MFKMKTRVLAICLSMIMLLTGVPLASAEAAAALGGLGVDQTAQAEDAALSGSAKKNTTVTGFTGSGYIDGIDTVGAGVSFKATVPTTLNYEVTLRYTSLLEQDSTLSIYVNGEKRITSTLPASTSGTWVNKMELLVLDSGVDNTIEYRFDAADQGSVALDSLTLKHYNPNSGTNPDPTRTNLLTNPGYESGDFTGWRGYGDRAVVTSSVYAGSYAARMGTIESSINQDLTHLKSNTTYTLKAWIHVTNVADQDQVYMTAEKFNGGSGQTYAMTSQTGYHQLRLQFKTGVSDTAAGIYIWKPATTGVIYVDDVALYEGEDEEGTDPGTGPGTDPGSGTNPDFPTYTVPEDGTNIAHGQKTYTSSVKSGTSGALAFDQEILTKWESAPADPQWLIVDLQDSYHIEQVALYWGSVFATQYQIQVSNDMITWKDVFSTTTGDGEEDTISFEGTDGRFVRVYATGRSGVGGYSLHEFEVYGEKNEVTSPGEGKVPPPLPHLPIPTDKQLAYQKMETIAFIHFGMNTFTGREWGTGTESPSQFNPTNFDAKQWITTLKDAGMKMVILTVKHHDGFVLYPSAYTEHSVKNSPWKGGQGDIVKEVSDAAHEAGLKFGVYLSPWDMNAPSYGQGQAYNDYYMNQLRELLTNYGEISEIWMDGAKGDNVQQDYDFDAWADLIYQLQPNALIWGPPLGDVRWNGNETGFMDETNWSKVVPNLPQNPPWSYVPPAYDNRDYLYGHANGTIYQPAESDVKTRSGWFWSANSTTKSVKQLVDIYHTTVGRGATLLLNVSPNTTGQIPAADVTTLKEWRTQLNTMYSNNLASNATAAASQVRGDSADYRAQNVLDNQYDTYWTVNDDQTTGNVEITLDKERAIDSVVIQEYVPLGQRISQYTIEAWVDGSWKEIKRGTTIGYQKIDTFSPVRTSKVRINITGSQAPPMLNSVEVFLTQPVSSENLALNKPASASNVHTNNSTYAASKAVDGNASTRWATDDIASSAWLEVDLGSVKTFDKAVINELTSRVSNFAIQYWNGEEWLNAHTGTTIGANKTITFTPVSGSKVRLAILSVNGTLGPSIWEFELYNTAVDDENLMPAVVSSNPQSNQNEVTVNKAISITFNKEMIMKHASGIVLRAQGGSDQAAVTAELKNNQLTITPSADLSYGTTYEVSLASDAVEDPYGNTLASDYVLQFTTVSQSQVSPGNTTYYVDNVTGSDSNNGLDEAHAWKSLSPVNAMTFMPGDQILFKAGGTWTGSLHPKGSGTEGKSIVIGKYGEGNKPVIQGQGAVENTVYLYNQQYWEIGHLEVTNKGAVKATSARRGVLVSGEDFEKGSTTNITETKTLRGIYIHDLYVHDVNGEDRKDVDGSSGIQVSVRIPGLVNGIPATGSVHQRTTFDDVRIINNVVRDVSRSGIMIWNDWKNRPLLGDGLDYGESSLTPWTPVTHVLIQGNKLYNIGGDGIVPHMTDGAVVEYNFLDGYNRTSTGYNAGMWTWDGDNTLYQFNEVTGGYSTRDGQPFDFDHATQGIIYQFNYTYNNDGGTLLVCADGRGGKVNGGIYRYNISQNDKYQTFTICGGSNVENVQIYNNVFYFKEGMNTKPLVSQGGGVDVSLYNNIFINLGTGTYTAKPTWKYSNNAFYGNNVPTKEQIPDPFMLTGDPLLVDPGKAGTVLNAIDQIIPEQVSWAALNGYKLAADSPMINAGRFISATHNPGTRDDFGNPLYNGMPDVGVHEYEAVQYPHVDPFEPVIPKPQAAIRNGDFENTSQHASSNPWNWQWNAGIVNDGNAHGGSYAGYIKEIADGGSLEQQIAVQPNTKYRLSAFAKSGSADQKLYLGVKWTDPAIGAQTAQIPVNSADYALHEVEFTTGSHTSSVTMYFWKDTGSAKKSYIDDVSIAEVVPVIVPVGKPSTSLSGPTSAEAGKTFTVKLGLKDIAADAYAQDIQLSYDTNAMTYVSAQSIVEGIRIIDEKDSNGVLRLIIVSEGAGHGIKGTKEMVELTFQAKSVSKETTGSVAVTAATLGDEEGNESTVEGSSVNVKITTEPVGVPGDANNDGKLSIGDLAIAAANYGKTSQSPDWDRIKLLDMDGDNTIDIDDLAAIANKIIL